MQNNLWTPSCYFRDRGRLFRYPCKLWERLETSRIRILDRIHRAVFSRSMNAYSINPTEDSGGYMRQCIDAKLGFRNLAGHLLMQRAVCLFNPKCRAHRQRWPKGKDILCPLCMYLKK